MTRGSLQRERRPVPLNIITGRSPQNCRQAIAGDDRSGLAASMIALEAATGEPLIAPLIVSEVPGSPLLAFHVHAGGRRWETLRDLAADGTFRPDRAIDCLVVDGDDEAIATEISLFENSLRRDLHPVEQCEAFEALRVAGVDETRIAADFALPLRTVRQRLRLTKLSPAVRAAWREGKLTTDQAQAFAVGQSHVAQDEVLSRFAPLIAMDNPCHHSTIRREMLQAAKACPFSGREATYVGLDAYRAAGGLFEEDLFADAPLIFDAPLLKRLAHEKMMREGAEIAAQEGYGFCFAMDAVENATWRFWDRIEEEYSPAEQTRLDALTDEGEAIQGDEDDARATLDRIEAEETDIHAKAYARAATTELRARSGILVAIDHQGALAVERGLFAPAAAKDAPPSETSRSPASSPVPPAAPAKPPKPSDPVEAAAAGLGQVRAILDETAGRAIVAVVSVRPDLALMFLVARFGGTWQPDQLETSIGVSPKYSDKPSERTGLLGRLDCKKYDDAIGLCADVPLGDLTVAVAAIVARSIRLQRTATISGLETTMRAFARRGAALGPALREAFDAERYFEAASKAACLAALDAMGSEAQRTAAKPAIAALAAAEAKAKGWLPFPLAGWAGVEPASPEAPAAMPRSIETTIAADAEIGVLAFLTAYVVETDPGGSIEQAALYFVYQAKAAHPVDLATFRDVLFELGIDEASDGTPIFWGIALGDAEA